MTQHDRALRYRVVADVLEGYCERAVRDAVDEYLRTPSKQGKAEKKFVPEPPELLELCREHQRMLIPRTKARPAKPRPL